MQILLVLVACILYCKILQKMTKQYYLTHCSCLIFLLVIFFYKHQAGGGGVCGKVPAPLKVKERLGSFNFSKLSGVKIGTHKQVLTI